MRPTAIAFAVLAASGAGVIAWQRMQIVELRAQAAEQAVALGDNRQRIDELSGRLAVAEEAEEKTAGQLRAISEAAGLGRTTGAALGDDERRLILARYRDVIAQLNLSPAAASRLGDLLVDRVETVLAAESAAERAGVPDGSPDMARVESESISPLDQEIAAVVGPGAGQLFGAPSVVVVAPAPATYVLAGVPDESAPVAPEPAQVSPNPAYPYYGYAVYGVAGPGWERRGERPREPRSPVQVGNRAPDAPAQVVMPANLTAVRAPR
jgi:hypothetical protein